MTYIPLNFYNQPTSFTPHTTKYYVTDESLKIIAWYPLLDTAIFYHKGCSIFEVLVGSKDVLLSINSVSI